MKVLCYILLILSFLLLVFSLISCEEKQEIHYRYKTIKVVPDSLKEKQQLFVVETVKAASFHMTGGDYEDPEDVIQQAKTTFEDIHGIPVEGLVKDFVFIKYNDLDSFERALFHKIKNNR